MKKGQAAMEFLMTYGWAILVVLAAIGALAYFGVLSPDKFLPEKCVANPPFSCSEYKVMGSNGLVNFTIKNNGGSDMDIVQVSFLCDGTTAWTSPGEAGNATGIQNGNGAAYWGTCSGITAVGQRAKGTMSIVYRTSGQSVTHTGSGSMQVKAE